MFPAIEDKACSGKKKKKKEKTIVSSGFALRKTVEYEAEPDNRVGKSLELKVCFYWIFEKKKKNMAISIWPRLNFLYLSLTVVRLSRSESPKK